MISQAVTHADHRPDACEPKLCGEIGVAVHPWGVFDAKTPDEVPDIAMHEVGCPRGSVPVGLGQGFTFPQQPFLLEVLHAVTIVGEDAHIKVVVWLDHGGGEEEPVVGQFLDLPP